MPTSSLRNQIALAIIKAFEEDVRSDETEAPNFDPDTCYRAADEVVALLLSRLTGQRFRTEFPEGVIGPARFVSDGVTYD